MIVVGLVSDHFWTERVSLIPDPTFAFLRNASLEVFPDIIGTEDSETGTFPLDDIAVNTDALRSATVSYL